MTPSPYRQNRMFQATIRCQVDTICRSTRFNSYLLHFNKLDANNIYLLTKSEYNDHFVLIFLPRFTRNQVDSTTDLLDDVDLTEVVL